MSLQNFFLGTVVIIISAYVGLYAAVLFRQRLIPRFKQEEHLNAIAGMAQLIIFMIVFAGIGIELSIFRIKLGLVPDGYESDFPGTVAGIAVNHAFWIIGACFTGFMMVMNQLISKRHAK
jgi:hypothetical protein